LSVPKIVVHTDVFRQHLSSEHGPQPSVLRVAMGKFFCYTTVFQAMELFAGVSTPREEKAVEDAMAAMKILGVNPKSARTYGGLLAKNHSRAVLDILTAGLCIESRLPLLTDRKGDFRNIAGLVIVPTRAVRTHTPGHEILRAAMEKP
jgi:predicted nucleic acid-binding protein